MPPALKVHCSKTGTPSVASMLTGVFILLLGCVINLCVMDAGFALDHAIAKHILYINSCPPGHNWSDDIQKGLIQGLQASDPDIELSVEYLDGRQFNKPALLNKQAGVPIVFCGGNYFRPGVLKGLSKIGGLNE